MRKGRRLAVDVGRARVGLAVSDIDGILASPLATIPRSDSVSDTAVEIAAAVSEFELLEIYVGLPLSLGGGSTASTQDAVNVAFALWRQIGVQVRFIDERLSSVSASANLRLAGRNAKNSRNVIDQEAAAIILEQALAWEKSSSNIPGTPLDSQDEESNA